MSSEEKARIFQEAISSYKNQEYELAEGYFQALISSGIKNGDLYFNIANAQFRQGRLGLAIANYLKALEFLPRDADLRHNLQFANKQTKDRIESSSWVALRSSLFFWFRSFNQKEWLWIFLSFNFICWLLGIGCLFYPNEGLKWSFIVTFCFMLLSGASVSAKSLFKDPQGVVLEPEISVYSGPSNTNTKLFLLHEGSRFRISDQEGSWLRIVLTDGKEGWLNRKSVTKVEDL